MLLDQQGEYSKYLDEFTRSLGGFRQIWQAKRWATFRTPTAVQGFLMLTRLYLSTNGDYVDHLPLRPPLHLRVGPLYTPARISRR